MFVTFYKSLMVSNHIFLLTLFPMGRGHMPPADLFVNVKNWQGAKALLFYFIFARILNILGHLHIWKKNYVCFVEVRWKIYRKYTRNYIHEITHNLLENGPNDFLFGQYLDINCRTHRNENPKKGWGVRNKNLKKKGRGCNFFFSKPIHFAYSQIFWDKF